MKKTIFTSFILLFTLLASSAFAQQTFIERFSIEAGAGYNLPISDADNVKSSDFAGFKSFYVGANYDLSDLFGLRLTYGYNEFEDKNDKSMGLTLHKFMAEATFNIIEAIEMQPNPFEVVGHAGVGGSLGKSSSLSGTDKMGNFQIGLMPKYHITDNFSIHFDASFILNFSQNYDYNGLQAFKNNDAGTGKYFLFNAGIAVRF